MPKKCSLNSSSREEAIDPLSMHKNKRKKFDSEMSTFTQDVEHPSSDDVKIIKEIIEKKLLFGNDA